MNRPLIFDFTVDKATNSLIAVREFAAGLPLVWKAWTEPELLDQWWAPKPYRAHTTSMDFRPGGHWLYHMEGPDGVVHWCRADYQRVVHHEAYEGLDAFCDAQGQVNTDMPRTHWTVEFSPTPDGTTTVRILTRYEKLADLEMILEMGFREGFSMALGNLDELLPELA